MVKSRLQSRRTAVTVAVKVKTLASGQYSEANVSGLGSVAATQEQRDAFEFTSDGGTIVTVTDVFWFEAAAGASLPAIEESHVLVDGSSVRYEVVNVQDQGGEGDRLRVMTRRLR
jgi:hypothetical protein